MNDESSGSSNQPRVLNATAGVEAVKIVVDTTDAKGLKVRGGSREMDLMMKAAGAATLSIPSNESYAAMQTGISGLSPRAIARHSA